MRDIDRASAWWKRNRDKAPRAFDEDVDAALAFLRTHPHAGTPYRGRASGIRSLWLDRIGYFIYYRQRANDVIEVVRLWHASRGSRPRF